MRCNERAFITERRELNQMNYPYGSPNFAGLAMSPSQRQMVSVGQIYGSQMLHGTMVLEYLPT